MSFSDQVDTYLRARFTLLVIVSSEEERALAEVVASCRKSHRSCRRWDLAFGLRDALTGGTAQPVDPKTLLEQIARTPPSEKVVYVLHDFHDIWKNDSLRRQLRSTVQALKTTSATVVVTTPTSQIPDSLRDEAVLIDLPLPTDKAISGVLERLVGDSGVNIQLDANGRRRLVQAALGLTLAQARRAFSEAIVTSKGLDDDSITFVTAQKKQILRESEALEFYTANETLDSVGGLDVLKNWLRLRERAFSQDAVDYGLPAPKGVALIGIPGTGKSLTAKMVSGLWRMPLLRLDAGALFGSLVGQSEERLRRAISLAETVAPCVLWIDEIEKALASGGLDGGTSQRVFGTILSWMQDKAAPVFIVATANDVSALPPELLRRGRFDEIFFLDLPIRSEREEIVKVHLRKRRRNPQLFDVVRLGHESEGFVGAEIEQAVVDAMYRAFDDGREVTTDDISVAITHLVPLSRSQRERIEMLRGWLKEGRAQSASFVQSSDAQRASVNLEV